MKKYNWNVQGCIEKNKYVHMYMVYGMEYTGYSIKRTPNFHNCLIEKYEINIYAAHITRKSTYISSFQIRFVGPRITEHDCLKLCEKKYV